jgi:glutamine cyclotransferase
MTIPTLMNCAHQGEGWCLACVGKLATDQDRLREALTWAVGFIRCNFPQTVAPYPDFRNAADLVAGEGAVLTGEFTMARYRAEVAEEEVRRLRAVVQAAYVEGWEEGNDFMVIQEGEQRESALRCWEESAAAKEITT